MISTRCTPHISAAQLPQESPDSDEIEDADLEKANGGKIEGDGVNVAGVHSAAGPFVGPAADVG